MWSRELRFFGLLVGVALAASGVAPAAPSRPVRPSIPAGSVVEATIASPDDSQPRRLWIYTPPGFASSRDSAYDLLIALDGDEYLHAIALPTILDSLLARHRAGPFVAVLVDDGRGATRSAELANHAPFVDFLATDVVDLARRKWRATRDPRRTIIAGSSAGGVAAAFAAFRHPNVFGNVLSQSGAFSDGNEGSHTPPYEWLTDQYRRAPKRDLRFVLEAGALETMPAMDGAAPSILDANRHLRDVLVAKDYTVRYAEVPNAGHGPEFWRLRIATGIVTLAKRP